MKGFFLGVLVTSLAIAVGLWYRNAVEHPSQPIACPMDAKICPDGTSVSRTGLSCTFEICPPPNISIKDLEISFAIPEGFNSITFPDSSSVAAYGSSNPQTETTASIIIRRFAITASSTALNTIQKTAIGGASGAPVSATSFSSTVLGSRRFTVVSIERFEGVIDTAYYLARGEDVLRFDAIDTGILNWTDPEMDTSKLPANEALVKILSTLQVD